MLNNEKIIDGKAQRRLLRTNFKTRIHSGEFYPLLGNIFVIIKVIVNNKSNSDGYVIHGKHSLSLKRAVMSVQIYKGLNVNLINLLI